MAPDAERLSEPAGPTAASTDAGAFTVETSLEIATLARDWDELVDRTGGSPFDRPGWIERWWNAFGEGRLEIVGVRRGGVLAALVPLARLDGLLRSTTNWHSVTSGVVAEDIETARVLARAIVERAGCSLEMGFLVRDGLALPALEHAMREAGWLQLVRTMQRSPYLDIQGDWESYERSRSKSLRGDVRRRRRRLEEQGALEIEIAREGAGLEEQLEEGFAIEGSGWKVERGTAISSHAETAAFYSSVAHWAAERGWLHLAFLRLNGRPLAFQLNLEAGGIHYHLKGGYDPAFERFSPGKVLHHAVLEQAFATGIRRYEFLGDADPYKMQWTDTAHERLRFQAFARSPAGVTAWLVQRYGRPLARRAVCALRSRRA